MTCPHCHATCNGIEHDDCQLSTVRIVKESAITKALFRDVPPTDHFWDEYGNEHSHNPNVIVTNYVCSNGHKFSERSSWQCACGWMACKQEIVKS